MNRFAEPPAPSPHPAPRTYRCSYCRFETVVPYPLIEADRVCPRCHRFSLYELTTPLLDLATAFEEYREEIRERAP